MRVLILVNHDLVVYNFRKELVHELLNLDNEVIISSPHGPRISKLEEMGAIHIPIQFDRHGSNPFSEIRILRKYLKLIEHQKPDIILSYTIKPNVYGSIAARIKKIPIIANVTGLGIAFNEKRYKSKLILYLNKFAFKKTSLIFFQNLENMEFLQRYINIKSRSFLLPGSGVNIDEFSFQSYPSNKNTIITYFGRIMEAKGIRELLSAIELLNQTEYKIDYHFIGFFESDEIKRLFYEYKERNSNILYFEHIQDVKAFISSSDAIILPSYHEGMSNSLLEAAAVGRPLLASDISGCKEIIDDSKNGFLFDVSDVNSIVEAIVKFENCSIEEKKSMGQYSRTKVVNEFDRSIVVNAYINSINKIIGEK